MMDRQVPQFFMLTINFMVGLIFCLCSERQAEAMVTLDGPGIINLGYGNNLCALTFDDGPGLQTNKLLDILAHYKVPATFFVVGQQIKYRPKVVVRMAAEGHEVGNHTYNHVTLRNLSPDRQLHEIKQVQDALAELGVTSKFVRPPYGRYSPDTIILAKSLGLEMTLWSVDSMDWSTVGKRYEPVRMKTLVKGQKLRGIFLFHDTHAVTVAAMPEILEYLLKDGCRFVTMSQFVEEAQGPTCYPDSPVPGIEAQISPNLEQAQASPAGQAPLQAAGQAAGQISGQAPGQVSGQVPVAPMPEKIPTAKAPSAEAKAQNLEKSSTLEQAPSIEAKVSSIEAKVSSMLNFPRLSF